MRRSGRWCGWGRDPLGGRGVWRLRRLRRGLTRWRLRRLCRPRRVRRGWGGWSGGRWWRLGLVRLRWRRLCRLLRRLARPDCPSRRSRWRSPRRRLPGVWLGGTGLGRPWRVRCLGRPSRRMLGGRTRRRRFRRGRCVRCGRCALCARCDPSVQFARPVPRTPRGERRDGRGWAARGRRRRSTAGPTTEYRRQAVAPGAQPQQTPADRTPADRNLADRSPADRTLADQWRPRGRCSWAGLRVGRTAGWPGGTGCLRPRTGTRWTRRRTARWPRRATRRCCAVRSGVVRAVRAGWSPRAGWTGCRNATSVKLLGSPSCVVCTGRYRTRTLFLCSLQSRAPKTCLISRLTGAPQERPAT
ncbi:hypothetical protein EV650_6844 [Kribbella kalugense]|uniref:Uncharacterized protein n=1 Tax=Kribbella kalugense TaxID=2512221 RepID=A0A4R7ZDQ8_9ACTN|nr:hypothetical protein EV650_6844 [Kribbella kalugense]